MNYYIVVEGKTERKVYKGWVKYLVPELQYVNAIYDISQNHYSIISGGGYPEYFKTIAIAIDDVNSHNGIDKLLISIDSEDMTFQEKYDEITDFLSGKYCSAQIEIIIQHFCFETWALGNKKIVPRNPSRSSEVYNFKIFFDVLNQDPEDLPPCSKYALTRSQFAFKYLVALLREKNSNYSKGHPEAVINIQFFNQIKNRLQTNKHIKSFNNFLNALP